MQSALVSASTLGRILSPSRSRKSGKFFRAFLGTWNKITSASNFIAAFSHGRVIYRSPYFCRLVAANNSVWPTARRGAGRNSARTRARARANRRVIRKRSQLPEVLSVKLDLFFSRYRDNLRKMKSHLFFVQLFSSNLSFTQLLLLSSRIFLSNGSTVRNLRRSAGNKRFTAQRLNFTSIPHVFVGIYICRVYT